MKATNIKLAVLAAVVSFNVRSAPVVSPNGTSIGSAEIDNTILNNVSLKNVVTTDDGIELSGQTITGLKDGKEGTDAVTVNQLNGKADTDASNIKKESWHTTLGTGKAEQGNTELVNGDAVYQAADKAEKNANNYTDGREKVINTRTDGLIKTEQNARVEGDRQTLTSANGYTDGREKVINSRTDGLIQREQTDRSAAIKAEAAARVQGDTQTLAAAKAHSDAGDVKTLNAASAYTDRQIRSVNYDAVLTEAGKYTDESARQTLNSANTYTDRRTAQAEDNAVARSQSYTNKRFGELKQRLDKTERRLNAGIAGVTALASIPYVPGSTFSYGIGGGNYRDGNALAAGVQFRTSASTSVRVNVSWDSAGNSAAGVGFAGGW
ncbi:hypothetical protein AI17_004241 [Salmonella enterica subsp. enterica serovar Oslo]|nr:hypothetical protein [Salmonella enterica subsp. houtenae]EEJ6747239.1 hypothetical protein [Salmonella enterica subsp. enterica serovar Oslo]